MRIGSEGLNYQKNHRVIAYFLLQIDLKGAGMEFKAHPLSVDNLFSLRKQYYVSRNQREFSWVEEQLQEFWFDILSNIKLIDDKFEH